MSEKHSLASKARMARYTKEERSDMMRAVALAKWKSISSEERSNHARKMSLARYNKKHE